MANIYWQMSSYCLTCVKCKWLLERKAFPGTSQICHQCTPVDCDVCNKTKTLEDFGNIPLAHLQQRDVKRCLQCMVCLQCGKTRDGYNFDGADTNCKRCSKGYTAKDANTYRLRNNANSNYMLHVA